MNYIIMSERVDVVLKEKYNDYCYEYKYEDSYENFLKYMLSYDGVFRIRSKQNDSGDLLLIGKNTGIYLEPHNLIKGCLWAKSLFTPKYDLSGDFEKSIPLKGEWKIIRNTEKNKISSNLNDLSYLYNEIEPSNSKYREFEENLKRWDTYNSLREKIEEEKEENSISSVKRVTVANNKFRIKLDDLNEFYIEGMTVEGAFSSYGKFANIGKIESVDKKNGAITVVCEDAELLDKYNKLEYTKVIDIGNKITIDRQKKAIKRLFGGDTVNKNLKNILTGEYEYNQEQRVDDLNLDDALELFGSNMIQKIAFINAINSQDIYLIQGPPGTGKTTIIKEIVEYVVQRDAKVLISSHTNIAVDNVLERVKYQDYIRPIRLGSEGSLSESVKEYIPENVSGKVLQDSKEILIDRQKKLYDLENALQEISDKYRKSIEKNEDAIQKIMIKEDLPENFEALQKSIDKFEKLIEDVNELYFNLHNEQKEYARLEQEKYTLEIEINKIQSNIDVNMLQNKAMGLPESANQQELSQLKENLKILYSKLESINKSLSKNRYVANISVYNRKSRKLQKDKEKLQNSINARESFYSRIENIKKAILEINLLQKQIVKYKNNELVELEQTKNNYERSLELLNKSKDIVDEWLEVIDTTETKNYIEYVYFQNVNTVFATCSMIAASRYSRFGEIDYDYVIIDEAAKCSMLDLIIPLIRGKKIILVGDHKQLAPYFNGEDEIKKILGEEQIKKLEDDILFKKLFEENMPEEFKITLNQQYRMEYKISEFISDKFYNSNLICMKDRNEKDSMIWVDCLKSQEVQDGSSCKNPQEAAVIVKLLKKLDKEYEKDTTVAVICIYKKQADEINRLIGSYDFKNINIECNTVDSFQGKEKHTIIFNTVKSSNVTEFMKTENRVNVAVSRAQEMLYIVGKADIMKNDRAGVLGDLYDYVSKYGAVKNDNYVM